MAAEQLAKASEAAVATRLRLDVDLRAPDIAVLPSLDATERLEVQLGHLVVDNAITLAQHEGASYTLDTMNVRLEKVGVFYRPPELASPHGGSGTQRLPLLDDVGIKVVVARPLGVAPGPKAPPLRVSAALGAIRAQVVDAHLRFVLQLVTSLRPLPPPPPPPLAAEPEPAPGPVSLAVPTAPVPAAATAAKPPGLHVVVDAELRAVAVRLSAATGPPRCFARPWTGLSMLTARWTRWACAAVAADATGLTAVDVAEFSLTELGAHVEVLPSADVAVSAKLTAIQATDLRCGALPIA